MEASPVGQRQDSDNLLIASQSISTEGNFSSTKLPISSNPESEKSKNVVNRGDHHPLSFSSSGKSLRALLQQRDEEA
ncbi:hypothetical protein IGI04_000068 [Brassica rapa subsp. trilocularis]|uniref:Uncharacterized protein n=1 Tax=Brassica rapa subsp. trilocularis TaxID=1813537 RepID=A0ABQ7NNU3_BRACM|nr:hypothetical protein IGI04_000068 [Brassica rapa subsp. trilocularis]